MGFLYLLVLAFTSISKVHSAVTLDYGSKVWDVDTRYVDRSCLYSYDNTSGTFASPGYPVLPKTKLQCGWVVRSPEDEAKINITFQNFGIKKENVGGRVGAVAKPCYIYDHVMVLKRNFDELWWTRVGNINGYCGTLPKFTILVEAKEVIVRLYTEKRNLGEYKGFDASYETVIPQVPPAMRCVHLTNKKCGDAQENLQVTEKTEVTFHCKVKSSSPPNYVWFQWAPVTVNLTVNATNQTSSSVNSTSAPISLNDTKIVWKWVVLDEKTNPRIVKRVFPNGSIWLKNLDIDKDTSQYKCQATADGRSELDFNVTVKEKCKCPKYITTNWYPFEPYTPKMINNTPAAGIFYDVLNKLLQDVCGTCPRGWGSSEIMWDTDNNMYRDVKKGLRKGISLMTELAETGKYDVSFPIAAEKGVDKFRDKYYLLPILDSPGISFIVRTPETGQTATRIFTAIFGAWTMMVVTILFAVLSGIIIWLLDTYWNEEQFPRRFLDGIWEGFWWAFVTMTTVGYGDIAPISFPARIFSIFWILTGLVIIAIFTGGLTSALEAGSAANDEQPLFQKKVGAISDSIEYRLGVTKQTKVKTYNDYTELGSALKDRSNHDITGALVDSYSAGSFKYKLGLEGVHPAAKVNKVIRSSKSFGFVLGSRLSSVNKEIYDYIIKNGQTIIQDVENNTQVVEPPDEVSTSEELFNPENSMFKNAMYGCAGIMFIFVVLGLIYEYRFLKRRRMRIHAAGTLEGVGASRSLQKMDRHVREARDGFLYEVDSFLENFEEKFNSITEKHDLENTLLLDTLDKTSTHFSNAVCKDKAVKIPIEEEEFHYQKAEPQQIEMKSMQEQTNHAFENETVAEENVDATPDEIKDATDDDVAIVAKDDSEDVHDQAGGRELEEDANETKDPFYSPRGVEEIPFDSGSNGSQVDLIPPSPEPNDQTKDKTD